MPQIKRCIWIAQRSVPETKETTLDLLADWAEMLDKEIPDIDKELDDKTFLEKACEEGKKLHLLTKNLYDKAKYKKLEMGIWVGFPETPIGRLNATLAGTVWHLDRFFNPP